MAAAPKKDDLKAKFEAAAAAAKQTKKKPDNATLLKLYSYYKQATDGDVKGDRPGGFDFVGGAKHDAWSKLKGMSKDDAMTELHQAGRQAEPRLIAAGCVTLWGWLQPAAPHRVRLKPELQGIATLRQAPRSARYVSCINPDGKRRSPTSTSGVRRAPGATSGMPSPRSTG